MKKVILTLSIVLSNIAIADNCDKPRDDFDGLYCLNKVYQQADKDLNKAYGELRGYLNKSEKSQLKKTQISWIEQRNNNCSLSQDNGFYVNLSCTTNTTVSRTNILNDRIRECKATGCQSSKL
jgi:uncharacterized protein YecT (DUF1311 family)